jgi:hypothetical protein
MARTFRESAALIEKLVLLLNSVIETTPGSGVYTPNTTVFTAAGHGPNGIIDYYGTLSRTGTQCINANCF